MQLMVLYTALFVGVLLAFDGLLQLFSRARSGEEAINRRLRMLASGADPEEVLRLLRRRRAPDGMERFPGLREWQALVTQSGIATEAGRLLVVLLMSTAGLFLILMVLGFAGHVAFLLALALGVALPVMVLVQVRSRRAGAIARQLPDGIDLMVRSLRAGHPLNGAFQVIAREMPDPLGSEMGIVADAITYGDDLTDAVTAFAERVGIEDARYLAVAINIQAGTGGNLAHVLEALAQVIRERFAMLRKIRALSAEGRLTAIIVSIVPLVIFAALNALSPTFYGDVADDPLYMPFLATGVVLTVMNAIVLRRLVRFHF
ncbi:MAG TPA: type II secretion system F family protein [Geminicoccaceae bacterium]|nr:type II secretion system F family protein [Geminicoccaceae bacterium]